MDHTDVHKYREKLYNHINKNNHTVVLKLILALIILEGFVYE